MNIDFKSFKSWNGYTLKESEFVEKTGFVEIRSFNFQTKDNEYNVTIGKIGDEIWYYKDNYGDIWYDDIGKVE